MPPSGSAEPLNYIQRVIQAYEKWSAGSELSEEEVLEVSTYLGNPTRKVRAFIDRFSAVIGRLIEERCSLVNSGRVCIYTWSRRAFKRYFPAALDAGGTILFISDGGKVELLSFPLHRAYDLGVRGVDLPGEGLEAVSPRIDGWQVNLYFDRVLGRWVFSTKYVLHNMRFERGKLVTEEYGTVINPLVETALKIAESKDMFSKLSKYFGWTFTFMVEGPEPASVSRSLPNPEFWEDYRLTLISVREEDGTLLPPHDARVGDIASELGVGSLTQEILKSSEVSEAVKLSEASVERPSHFLWFRGGEPHHPRYYEVRSRYYEDFVGAVRRADGKSLIILLTSENPDVVSKVKEVMGMVAEEVHSALMELSDVLKSVDPDRLELLLEFGVPRKAIDQVVRALREGKLGRAIRIVTANALQGVGTGEVAALLKAMAERIK